MPSYEQVPVRLLVSLVSNPPDGPVDQSTQLPPKFFRASAAAVQVGIFDNLGQSVDLSNLVSLQLVLQNAPDSPIPLFVSTLPLVDLIPTITQEGWNDGSEQQAQFNLTPAMLDQSLGGETSAQFWLMLQGITSAGNVIVYVAGYCSIYLASSALPLPPFGYVSKDKQTNNSGDTTAVIGSLDHTEVITLGGTARTSNLILPVAGMADGALLRLILSLPGTAGIILQVRNASISGPILSTFETGSTLNAVALYYFDEPTLSWVPYLYAMPGI